MQPEEEALDGSLKIKEAFLGQGRLRKFFPNKNLKKEVNQTLANQVFSVL